MCNPVFREIFYIYTVVQRQLQHKYDWTSQFSASLMASRQWFSQWDYVMIEILDFLSSASTLIVSTDSSETLQAPPDELNRALATCFPKDLWKRKLVMRRRCRLVHALCWKRSWEAYLAKQSAWEVILRLWGRVKFDCVAYILLGSIKDAVCGGCVRDNSNGYVVLASQEMKASLFTVLVVPNAILL